MHRGSCFNMRSLMKNPHGNGWFTVLTAGITMASADGKIKIVKSSVSFLTIQ